MRVSSCVAPILAVLLLSGCTSPAWDDHDYGLKAAQSAESAASSLEIVRLAVRHEDRLTTSYLKTLFTEAVKDLGGVNSQFGGVQPPSPSADEVRGRLLDLTGEAEDQVTSLLIQVRRDGIEDPEAAVKDLEGVAAKLRAFEEAHQ
ncbi:hypothetical protein [Nonomuraea aurantiaca]|uniref:hypothetical protein n=1 Tax=Nonomuraea aurantiaca TaxID=2878562 RepID=UPI001CD96ABB|nr:hypothetical protein [Nonomuraea aurantiaca]MCA2226167.1 hypothetical protein [Nonomuraea aurantiaca]